MNSSNDSDRPQPAKAADLSRVILTPEQSQSGTCVILRAPGHLYIQSFDAYGFQRELTLVESKHVSAQGGGFELHV